MCKIQYNHDKNGIELIFDNKPEQAIIDSIKAAGFRWNRATRVWYAKQTPERVTFANSLGEIENATPAGDNINMEGVGSKKKTCYGADFAGVIREELKKRGVKGVTVRSHRGGYTDSFTITVKADAADFASLEEFEERFNYSAFTCKVQTHGIYNGSKWIYENDFETLSDPERRACFEAYMRYQIKRCDSFNKYHTERRNYPELTTAFWQKLCNICKIANQWNYDNSDLMTDYHDVGYYLDIDIKAGDFEPREKMTDAERDALIAEREREAAERAAAMAKYEEERRQAEIERAQYEAELKAATERVYNHIRVEDLSESERLFVDNLRRGIGKEASLDELRADADRDALPAVVSRKIIFTDEAIYNDFGRFLGFEWVFVAGMGGSETQDIRLDALSVPENDDPTETQKDFYGVYSQLTQIQRDSIAWYNTNCIGIYVNDDLRLVIDPQGYNYARYTFLADEAEIAPAPAELARLKAESENLPPFYIPVDVKKQAEIIKEGDAITIYQSDGWNLCNIEGARGIVTGIWEGKYAQYEGLYIELIHGKKTTRAFIRNNKDTLIYRGIKDKLPASVTKRRVSDTMSELLTTDALFVNTLNYYAEQGESPIVDTIAR